MGSVFVIGSKEVVIGFRLAGVKGEVAEDRESALKALNRALSAGSYKLILISEGIGELLRNEIEEIRAKELYPIVLEVPEMGGWRKKPHNYLERAIREALGLNIKE